MQRYTPQNVPIPVDRQDFLRTVSQILWVLSRLFQKRHTPQELSHLGYPHGEYLGSDRTLCTLIVAV